MILDEKLPDTDVRDNIFNIIPEDVLKHAVNNVTSIIRRLITFTSMSLMRNSKRHGDFYLIYCPEFILKVMPQLRH